MSRICCAARDFGGQPSPSSTTMRRALRKPDVHVLQAAQAARERAEARRKQRQRPDLARPRDDDDSDSEDEYVYCLAKPHHHSTSAPALSRRAVPGPGRSAPASCVRFSSPCCLMRLSMLTKCQQCTPPVFFNTTPSSDAVRSPVAPIPRP